MDDQADGRKRRLIEDWLPIAEIGAESLRERTPMTPFPAPNRLHVWFARRPLVASRAAILASLLPAEADRAKFLHALGIHGDPMAAKKAMVEAVRKGERIANPYNYPRAFQYSPSAEDRDWIRGEVKRAGVQSPTVLDPTAGGGSIPFEAVRLGFNTIANDLNPVAWLILKATVEFPARFGSPILKRYNELAEIWKRRLHERMVPFYPIDPDPIIEDATYLWARTILCPYCAGVVPLSPNWKLDGKGTGVRLVPQTADPEHRRCSFEIVVKGKDHSPGTVKAGDGLCPYPDCGRVIDGDEVKSQAQTVGMGQQLYTVVFKRKEVVGYSANRKPKIKVTRGFRAPRPEDDVDDLIRETMEFKRTEWEARNIIPNEEVPDGNRVKIRDRIDLYGFETWLKFFSPRQLLGHCTSVEVFQDVLMEAVAQNKGEISELDRAALTYLAITIDKMVNYNSISSRWDTVRVAVRGKFDRHDFAFQWSYGELIPTAIGLGYDWAVEQTGKALAEMINLVEQNS